MDPSAWVTLFGGTALGALMALFAVLSRKGRSEDEARAYLAGFTYVISDDPDAAIAELSRAAQLNRQTLETYFALGALFRRKGELGRAIRLHSNILLRPGLLPEVRRRAQLALALDYKRSGLRDKASEAFEKLLGDEPEHRDGLLNYRQVLESARDWDRAIELQVRLMSIEGRGGNILAHLLAEASRARRSDDSEVALDLAGKAASLIPACADAQLALAEARIGAGNPREGAQPIERALALEPELAPRSVGLLAQALVSRAHIERFLLAQLEARGERGAPYELALALHDRQRGDGDRAIERLRDLVRRRPLFWEARKELGSLLLAHDRSQELRADYEGILGTLGRPAMGLVCTGCRQKLPEFVFRCPACEGWDLVRREEGSLSA